MLFLPFFVRDKQLIRVDPQNVALLETVRNYTKIELFNETYYMVRSSLAGAQKKLPPDMFIRVHRSYVVSIYYIVSINRDHLLIGEQPIPIGKQYYKSLMDKLNIIE